MMVIRIVRQLLYLVSGGSIFDAKYLNDEVVVDVISRSDGIVIQATFCEFRKESGIS